MALELQESEFIWKDGTFIRWQDARVHLLSLAVQFGVSLFEGIRCYESGGRRAIFRLGAHIRRLYNSCIVYRMAPEYSREEYARACVDAVAKNGLGSCYIRPMVIRGYGAAALDPRASPIESYVACWPLDTYLGAGALEKGVGVKVSSWQRAEPNTFPMRAKAAGHYNAAMLMKMEAHADGYADAIALGPNGLVSEGSGQNLFLVVDGQLITPILDGTSLQGITRDTVLKLAAEMGIPASEQLVARETLYTCDELFFSGTATEVTPITSVDRIPVGSGKAGEVTLQIQRRFMDIVKQRAEDPYGWLTQV
ncbi:MAG: branched-chain amino acid transaminase [Gammaproteobacteria bacterium]|nr:branched-chain amino acid transaminase [Gammaproteobacteria bacterium]MDE0257846.1 branched-chain amino acid transaminase [Gammaproteobacteria bacterium]